MKEKPEVIARLLHLRQLSVYTDMAPLSRLERLYLAALRLRDIHDEAEAIYRRFPELDPRPKTNWAKRTGPIAAHEAAPITRTRLH